MTDCLSVTGKGLKAAVPYFLSRCSAPYKPPVKLRISALVALASMVRLTLSGGLTPDIAFPLRLTGHRGLPCTHMVRVGPCMHIRCRQSRREPGA